MLVMTNYAKNHVCSHNLPKPRRAISLVQTLYTGSLACLRRRLVSHRFSFSVQKSFILLILKTKTATILFISSSPQPFSAFFCPAWASVVSGKREEREAKRGESKEREMPSPLSLLPSPVRPLVKSPLPWPLRKVGYSPHFILFPFSVQFASSSFLRFFKG